MLRARLFSRRTGILAAAAAFLIVGLAVAGTQVASAGTPPATLAASAGCGKSPALASGTRTVQSGGKNRSFILRFPDGYDSNRQYRLIFGFHWNGGTAGDVDGGGTSGYPWSYCGLRALSDNSTIFVAPQGLGNGWANSTIAPNASVNVGFQAAHAGNTAVPAAFTLNGASCTTA